MGFTIGDETILKKFTTRRADIHLHLRGLAIAVE
jgi:hypothetical protein